MKLLHYVCAAIFVSTLLISACTQKKQASIEIKPPNFLTDKSPASYKQFKTPTQLKNAGLNYYLVKSEDNILTISKKLRIDIPIIVEINGLQPPYRLKPGDTLYLPNEALEEDDYTETAAEEAPKNINSKVETSEIAEPELGPVNKFIWPVKGKVVSKFGSKPGGITNNGINIKAVAGADVKSVAAGKVIFVGRDIKGYGNLILVKHNSEWVSAYAHQKQILVKKGDFVEQGQVIGSVGKTGDVKTPQLHFALRKDGKSVNPLNYISG